MIQATRYRRSLVRSRSAYWLDIKVDGRPEWIETGLIERTGSRPSMGRWRWICVGSDQDPRSGREETRGEARTALLAHIRDGEHNHTTSRQAEKDPADV